MRAIYLTDREAEYRSVRTARRSVTDAMSSPVYTVLADVLLGDALAAMVRSGRRHLLAVDDAQPLGIVPGSDLIALLAR